jgi:hypothetical protein
LYYGVEVVQHDPLDRPVSTGYVWVEYVVNGMIEAHGRPIADGRANLFSTDGGNKWEKLSDHLNGDPQIFLIRATLEKNPGTAKKDRLMGYRVFRDGVNVLGTGSLTSLNNYTDTLPHTGISCYKIHAFYTTAKPSSGIETCIELAQTSNEQIKKAENKLKVYPSFIQSGETITVETGNAAGNTLRLYDAMGKTVKEIPVKGNTTSIRINVASGVYMLQLGSKQSAKLIVK